MRRRVPATGSFDSEAGQASEICLEREPEEDFVCVRGQSGLKRKKPSYQRGLCAGDLHQRLTWLGVHYFVSAP